MSEEGLRVEFAVQFTRGASGRRRVEPRPPNPPPRKKAAGHVPRLSRLMALAIRFDDLVRRGEVEDYADIARLGHITRARVSQICNLLNLAPDIQEQILNLPPAAGDRDAVPERLVRPITTRPDWGEQRKLWGRMVGRLASR